VQICSVFSWLTDFLFCWNWVPGGLDVVQPANLLFPLDFADRLNFKC
jgi:hypothetical protein